MAQRELRPNGGVWMRRLRDENLDASIQMHHVEAAIREVYAWSEQPNVRVLAADQDHWQQVCRLLREAGGSGNLVADAQLGAFALTYRGTVHTGDTDFQRFPGVSWLNPITPAQKPERVSQQILTDFS